MATYPDLDLSFQSTRETDGGVSLQLSPNGEPFTQSHFANNWFVFTLIHPLIPSSDKNTLETFWATNRDLAFDLTPYKKDNVNYIDCRFYPEGVQSQRVKGDLWTCRAVFRARKA